MPLDKESEESPDTNQNPCLKVESMAQSNNNSSIVASETLMSFARKHGKMQVGSFTNGETGDEFKSCIFTDNMGARCFVAFSSNLGELSPRQIAAQKNDLQVVQLESGNYKLCRQGSNTWEDVDL